MSGLQHTPWSFIRVCRGSGEKDCGCPLGSESNPWPTLISSTEGMSPSFNSKELNLLNTKDELGRFPPRVSTNTD